MAKVELIPFSYRRKGFGMRAINSPGGRILILVFLVILGLISERLGVPYAKEYRPDHPRHSNGCIGRRAPQGMRNQTTATVAMREIDYEEWLDSNAGADFDER
jgi:hypothetical protein